MINTTLDSQTPNLEPHRRKGCIRVSLHILFSFWFLNFALSQIPPDRGSLLNAEGKGQAKYAEMNGYPGPKHILDHAKELQLTDAQTKSIQRIYTEMSARAKELGQRIVGIEEELNDAFKSGLVSEKSVRDDAEQIGKLRGRLRGVHLITNLKAKSVLTTSQLETCRKLRGEGRQDP